MAMIEKSTSSSPVTLWELMKIYTKIGILGFGGGFAVLAFIRAQIVTQKGWLTQTQFDHVVEMSAFAPGPTTTNVLAAISYRLLGWRGIVLGSIAALWPSFLLILVLAKLTDVLHSVWVTGALRGMEVAVVGLLVDVVWTLWKDVPHRIATGVVAIFALVLTIIGVNPVVIVFAAALFGLLEYLIRLKSSQPGHKAGSRGSD
ncbi:chromate transporter [Sulfobacillus thermosulfidooxidans]|uniref:chromate transporter n=1 Tax=Sulfobacillus thermosulfidooxidans TaxID=28034 RepID=UPI000A8FBB7C|nr:chromate transporter [Sulfobacillus thermosulfidooxidans]